MEHKINIFRRLESCGPDHQMLLITEEEKLSVTRHLNFNDLMSESVDIIMVCTQATEQERPKAK
jgi:hypothetical protein